MSDATLYHSVVREDPKTQCGLCQIHNAYHAIWCPEANYGGK